MEPERSQMRIQYGAWDLHAGLVRLHARTHTHKPTRPKLLMKGVYFYSPCVLWWPGNGQFYFFLNSAAAAHDSEQLSRWNDWLRYACDTSDSRKQPDHHTMSRAVVQPAYQRLKQACSSRHEDLQQRRQEFQTTIRLCEFTGLRYNDVTLVNVVKASWENRRTFPLIL
jgi:hypothetical protein